MPPLLRSSLLMLGSVEPNLPRPFGSSRKGPHSLSPFEGSGFSIRKLSRLSCQAGLGIL